MGTAISRAELSCSSYELSVLTCRDHGETVYHAGPATNSFVPAEMEIDLSDIEEIQDSAFSVDHDGCRIAANPIDCNTLLIYVLGIPLKFLQ